MTDAAAFNKARIAFLHRASAPHILPHAFKLAWLLAFKYMSRETGTARPAQETLAADLNVSTRTVRRLVDILKPLGLTVVPGHGPNQASTYWLDPENRTPVSGSEPENRTAVSAIDEGKADIRCTKSGHLTTENRTPVSTQPNKRTNKGTKKGRYISPAGRASRRSKQGDAPAKPKPAELAAAFDRFWTVYPKRVAPEAARKAFAKAIEQGADADALIAGAQRYAVERSGQEPRYTAHPARWITEGRWQDEPAGAPVIDEQGNVVAYDTPQQDAAPQRGKGFDSIAEDLIANHKKNEWGW